MNTSFFFLAAWRRMTSVPCTLVSIVCTGRSTISFTPTAAARWKIDVGAIDHLRDQRIVEDRVDGVVETRVGLEVGDVVDRAGRQVVERIDLVAAVEQRLGQVRADEARAAGDQNSHLCILPVA